MFRTTIPPALMPAYLAAGMHNAARAYIQCIRLAMVTLLVFGVRDWLVAPHDIAQQTIAIRCLPLALGLALLIRTHARPGARELYWSAYLFMNVMIVSLAAIYALLPNGLLLNHTALFMVPMLGALFTPTLPPMLFALANCVVSTQLALLWQPPDPLALASLNASLAIVFAFTVFLALHGIRARQRQFLLERRLHEDATRDPMTGAYNRRYFRDIAETEINRAKRHQRPLSLLLFDLDHFKSINDRYGHATGDRVICQSVDTLQRGLRASDVLARVGGEEIAVLLPETDRAAALQLAERLRLAIAGGQLALNADALLHWQTSVGVATLRDTDTQLEDLLARADTRLYQAKRGGRNRVVASTVPAV